MKLPALILLMASAIATATATADAGQPAPIRAKAPIRSHDIIIETFILRPLGFICTLAGAGMFIATLPATAFASIPPPHKVVGDAASFFVVAPGEFTFIRPFNQMPDAIDESIYEKDPVE